MNIKNTIHSAPDAAPPSTWLRPALIALAVLGTAFVGTGCSKDDTTRDDDHMNGSGDHRNHRK